MFNEFIEYLDNMQELIFNYEFREANQVFVENMLLWEAVIKSLAPKELEILNSYLVEILGTQQKEDYLLMADLFEYKVKPLLFKVMKNKQMEIH